jgi:hypothetical protein
VIRAVTTVARAGFQAPSTGYRVADETVFLGQLKMEGGRHVLYCRATLEPVVELALAEAGYDVTVSGHISRPLPSPCVDHYDPAAPHDHLLLNTVQHHEWAMIRYDADAVNPSWLIAQIVLAWPDKTIAIMVRRLGDARCLRNCLRQFGLDVTLASSKYHPAGHARVLITTPVGLAQAPADMAWLDIIIAFDAIEATGKQDSFCLSRATRARLYGLLPTNVRPSPLEQDLICSLFGFHEVLIPRHGCQERSVQVIHYPIEGGMPLVPDLDVLRLKRRGLWHHGVRNRKLTQIAKAFTSGDKERIAQMLADAKINVTGQAGVVVLVENIEHALVLARLLPGWPVWAKDDFIDDDLSPKEIERLHLVLDPFRDDPIRAIVTQAALSTGINLRAVDVVVRADGGVGLPPVDPRDLIVPDSPVQPLLLVDFHDRHHRVLRHQSRLRKEAYTERGWLPPGSDPVQSRVKRYLANRRGGANER